MAVILEGALHTMAADKNVAVAPELVATIAGEVAVYMDAAVASGLVKGAPGAVVHAAMVLNGLLDRLAARDIIRLIWRAEGFEQLDDSFVGARADAWISRTVAPHVIDNRFRWPDPLIMLKDYLRARHGSRVSVIMPDGGKRLVAIFVDPVRCRAAAGGDANLAAFTTDHGSGAKRPPSPVPQLIRCEGLPGTTRCQMPDGSCVNRLPDGGVITSFWKDGRQHRPAQEGPACLEMDASGTCVFEAHRTHGALHRDPADGPAVILRDAGGRILREEYWVHGEEYAREAEHV